MPVTLSIENAPDDVVERLRERAARHHRSIESEALAIIDEATRETKRLTPSEVLAEIRRLGLRTPSESVEIVRAFRDGR